MDIKQIINGIRKFEGLTRKREIPSALKAMGSLAPDNILDEDGVLLRHGGGYIVIACDSIQPEICRKAPYFAGRSAVFASVNDVAAMGGKPLKIVNASGAEDEDNLKKIIWGMAEAAQIFGLTIDGGHILPTGSASNATVTVVGTAKKPLLSSTLSPDHLLLFVTDLKGTRPNNWRHAWNTTTGKSNQQIRGRYTALRRLAEEGMLTAGKDISNAGILGTIAILLETSNVGGIIDLKAIKIPRGITPLDWYCTFLSFGFILGMQRKNRKKVISRLKRKGLFANIIGYATSSSEVILEHETDTAILFDWKYDTIIK